MQELTYVAQFVPDDENPSVYTVTFPDLAGCITQGDTLEEAQDMAREALACHVRGMLADGDALPKPSTWIETIAKAEKEAKANGETLPSGTRYFEASLELTFYVRGRS